MKTNEPTSGGGNVDDEKNDAGETAAKADGGANAAIGPDAGDPTAAELARFRRDLHRIPELDFELPETIAYVRGVLDGLPCEVFSPCRSTVCALFDRGTEHATAIRTDMDALPVTERTGAAFCSTHEGRMHACGHDGHMAMALGLARWCAEHADELPRSVLIVFQPAEETTGGARFVCESGVFERYGVDRIFGFHLWPDLPKGRIASRSGALLAAASETTLEFHGKATHIAKAADGADSLEAGMRFLAEAYDYMDARRAEEPCLLKFGRMESGQVRNVISSRTRLEGSLRTFSEAMGARVKADLTAIARRRAADAGCTVDVHFAEGYPPVVNDAGLFAAAGARLPQLDVLDEPLLIGEDFAFYQRCLPGVFLLLGTGTGIPLHADTFDFDESILMAGLEAYKALVRMP